MTASPEPSRLSSCTGQTTKLQNREFPLWFSRLRTQYCVCEDVGSTPDLAQWVKDPALLQLVSYGIGLSCSSNLSPCRETSICHRHGHKEKRKIQNSRTTGHWALSSWNDGYCVLLAPCRPPAPRPGLLGLGPPFASSTPKACTPCSPRDGSSANTFLGNRPWPW